MFDVPDLLSLKTLKFDKFEAAGREACGGREMGMSSLSCDGNVIEMTRQRLVDDLTACLQDQSGPVGWRPDGPQNRRNAAL